MKIIELTDRVLFSDDIIQIYEDCHHYYVTTKNGTYNIYESDYFKIKNYLLSLNDKVEILEEEKKIPEKLGYFDLTKDKNEKDENGNDLELHYTGVADTFDDVYEKINEIIDYLKSKGE